VAGQQHPTFQLIQSPLERQLRGLNVALRGGAAQRTWRHAADAVALVNEVTDLSLRAEDLLKALLEGAEGGSNGQEVLDGLLELGVQRRLLARGSLVVEDGVSRFTRDEDDLRQEVRCLLGAASDSLVDRDPRWRALLEHDD
jgi:hypothetical protein